jgi:hypothetical protein
VAASTNCGSFLVDQGIYEEWQFPRHAFHEASSSLELANNVIVKAGTMVEWHWAFLIVEMRAISLTRSWRQELFYCVAYDDGYSCFLSDSTDQSYTNCGLRDLPK